MMEKAEKKRLTAKQLKFLTVFKNSSCNISVACNKMGISRQVYYKWKRTNEKFAQEVEDLEDSLIDYAETKLQQNIMDGKEASIFFFLKTKGKKRGYVEKVEQEVTVNPFEELMKSLPEV